MQRVVTVDVQQKVGAQTDVAVASAGAAQHRLIREQARSSSAEQLHLLLAIDKIHDVM